MIEEKIITENIAKEIKTITERYNNINIILSNNQNLRIKNVEVFSNTFLFTLYNGDHVYSENMNDTCLYVKFNKDDVNLYLARLIKIYKI